MPDISDLLLHYNINIPSHAPGRYYTTCPWCSGKRRRNHQRLKVFGVTITDDDKLYFGCNHCHITGPTTGVRDELPHYDYGTDTRKTRSNGKFSWEHRNDSGSWENGSGGSISKLYRIDEAIEAGGAVLVVEGEKDVDSLWTIGFPATCHPHGAGNWTAAHSAQLKGLAIVVLNDNDEVGYKYAASVVKHSLGVASSVRRLDLKDYWPQIGPGEDVSDWLDHGGGSEDWLERIIAELPEINGHEERGEKEPEATLISIRADGVKMTAVKWLWPGRFAFGKLGLVSGLPDEGKGQFLWFVAAKATRGGIWPCGEGEASTGNVLVLQCEDDLSDTVVPRLVAAGADLSKIHIVSMVRTESGGNRMPNLAQDLAMLQRKIEEIGNIAVVLIDPLSAYMGRTREVDTFRTTDVRNVLSPLAALAADLDVAIISIMHFNKKTDVNNVLLRVSDSGAFTAQSRHLYGVISDPEDKARKLLVRGKNNLAPAGQKSLAYRFAVQLVGTDAKSGEEIWAPYIIFDPEPVDIDPAEAMSNGSGRPKDQRNKIKDWLRGQLAMGTMKLPDLKKAWEAEGFSKPTVYRAKEELLIVSKVDDGTYYWSLPETVS